MVLEKVFHGKMKVVQDFEDCFKQHESISYDKKSEVEIIGV
ncbi:unnamed protein product [Brassica oleracea]